MWQRFIQLLEHHTLDCYFKKYFGFSCMGCGMQRSIIELLKGNVIGSIKFYPALLPLITLVAFLILHLKYDFKYGTLILKILFIVCVLLILYNFIITNF